MKLAAHPYQKIGSRFIKDRKYVLIGDEMGLGKTPQSLAVMEEVCEKGGICVVVCPAMLRFMWRKEIKKFTNLSSAIVKGKDYDFQRVPDVFIVSYEGLKHIPHDLKPAMVVFDECHYLKNPQAQRTKTAHEFIWDIRPEYCVGLSGTPIKNNVGEFYSILKLLSYSPTSSNGIPLKEKSQYAFQLKFSNPITKTINLKPKDGEQRGRSIEISEFHGLRNKDLLKSYLKNKYIRRVASKVLDLPPITSMNVRLDDKDTITSRRLLAAYNTWIQEGKMGDHITQLKVASAMEKVPFTCSYLLNMTEQGERVVVFSDHVDPLIAIGKTMAKSKVICEEITGNVSSKEREARIDRFQKGRTQVLACSIRAASTGLTLTRARNLVFNDLSWVPADIEQARKRIHRIGQEHPCVIHYMLQGEIDERIQEKILEKSALMKEIL